MKDQFAAVLLVFTSLAFSGLHAQSIEPVLIAPVGGYVETDQNALGWSVGEIAVQHLLQSSGWLTEGFQQPDAEPVIIPIDGNDPKKIKILIPNTFTPNDDGINDTFDPLAVLAGFNLYVPENKAQLYVVNRWGELVFNANPYHPFAGKTDRGLVLPQSTYYYVLVLQTSREIRVKGSLHLLSEK